MMEMKLRSVPYGTTFRAFGEEFVALDYADGGVLAIRKAVWKCAAFDEGGVNDLRSASIGRALEEYLNVLKDGGAKLGDIVNMTIDLKAVDGTREYGYYETRIGLLTLEQYGKYQHIIPDADDWWWLATPWRTPKEKSGGAARALLVYTNGYWNRNNCSGAGYAIRPALALSSSLLVSVEDMEDGTDDEEDAAYSAYLGYVQEWPDGEHETGDSPMSYEEWKEAGA